MAAQNPRDMRDYMRTLERLTIQQRAIPALINSTITEYKEEEQAQKARRPAPPVELVPGSGFYQDLVLGRQRVRFYLDFPDVVYNTDGTKATIKQYELWGRDETDATEEAPASEIPWEIQSTSNTSSFRVDKYIPGRVWRFRVRALGTESVVPGDWSEEITFQMLRDTTPPPQATAPIAEASRGVITVKWDGKAVSGEMPSDFSYAILAQGSESSPTVEVFRFGPEGGFTVLAGMEYYKTQFFRVCAVDESGNLGPWSEQATAVTTPLVDTDVALSEIDAAKTQIINADKIILESGVELSVRLQGADKAIADTNTALTGPGGLTERLTGAEKKLSDVGSLTYATGQTLRDKLAENDRALGTAQDALDLLPDQLEAIRIAKVDIGRLTAGTANLGEAVANKFFANIFASNKLTTNQLLVGKGENMIPWFVNRPANVRTLDPHLPTLGSTFYFENTGGRSNGPHGYVDNQTVVAGARQEIFRFHPSAPAKNGLNNTFDVEPNTRYKISVWVRAGGEYANGYPTVQLHTQAYQWNSVYESMSAVFSPAVVDFNFSWKELVHEFTTGPAAASVMVRLYTDKPGIVRIDDPMMVKDGASLIATGGIVADHITASEAMSAKIGTFLKLNVDQLTATGTSVLNQAVVENLWANVVRSKQITTDMMLVGKGANLVPNGDLAKGREGWNTQFGVYTGDPAAKLKGFPASLWILGNQNGRSTESFQIKAGAEYRFSVWARGNVVGKRFYVQVIGNGDAPNPYPISNQETNTAFTLHEGTFIAPTNSTSATLLIYANHPNGVTSEGYQWFTGFELHEMNAASLIVNGGIVTKHLTVTEDMTVALLKVHKVKAGEIDVNSLAADTAFVGLLDAKIVKADMFSGKVFSGGTFTGSVFQTTTTANRGVQFDATGIRAWNASGTNTFTLAASNGDITIREGTFTGGMFQTVATASRGVKLSTAGLHAYNSKGAVTFILDALEGDAQFESRVRFGGKETPSWVFVPWESATSERAGLWLVNGNTNGIGGTNTAGLFMDNSNATFVNPMQLRGMNGGGVNIWGRLESNDMYSGTIHHAGGLYHLQGGNGSYFQSQVIFNGRIQYAGAPATTQASNAFIATDGTIWKSSSASRYKIDQQVSALPDSLLELEFKDWIDKGQVDRYTEISSGPRPLTENDSNWLDMAYLGRVGGVVAEDVEAMAGDAAQLFVTYGHEGRIEGVAYDRLGVALALKLAGKVNELAAELAALKGVN